jgi:hypothetical protein
VDPEMLGKIFEKLISVSKDNIWEIVEKYTNSKGKKVEVDNILNKQLWAFYTPRKVVHYIAKESLIAYLVNNLRWTKEEKEKKIKNLFEFKEKYLKEEDKVLQEEEKKVKFEKEFWEIKEIAFDVFDSLEKIKVLDPAVWSGAFPMWILHEISTLKYYIIDVFKNRLRLGEKIEMYKIKKYIIQNNIFWVDIAPWAIDIARLRFWLSLVVDEENPETLPNFEFKFVSANI